MSCFVKSTVQKLEDVQFVITEDEEKQHFFFFLQLRMWNCEVGETIPDAAGSFLQVLLIFPMENVT